MKEQISATARVDGKKEMAILTNKLDQLSYKTLAVKLGLDNIKDRASVIAHIATHFLQKSSISDNVDQQELTNQFYEVGAHLNKVLPDFKSCIVLNVNEPFSFIIFYAYNDKEEREHHKERVEFEDSNFTKEARETKKEEPEPQTGGLIQ